MHKTYYLIMGTIPTMPEFGEKLFSVYETLPQAIEGLAKLPSEAAMGEGAVEMKYEITKFHNRY